MEKLIKFTSVFCVQIYWIWQIKVGLRFVVYDKPSHQSRLIRIQIATIGDILTTQ